MSLFRHFITHIWLMFIRSPRLSQQLLQSVFGGLFLLYLCITFIGLGWILPELLANATFSVPLDHAVILFSLVYFTIDILLRLLLQKYPFVQIKGYLSLAIPKTTLWHFLLIKSILNIFNLLPLILIIPLLLRSYSSQWMDYSQVSHVFFIILGLTLFNHYFSFVIQQYSLIRPRAVLLLIILSACIFFAGFKGIIPPVSFGLIISGSLLSHWATALVPIISAGAMYYLGHHLLSIRGYLEDFQPNKPSQFLTSSRGFFSTYGIIGRLMDFELKLMLRNRRSRQFLIMGLVIVFYPLLFLDPPFMFMRIFIPFVVTGIITLNYGQFFLSWNSPHFDFILTRHIKMEEVFLAKYYLMVFSALLMFTICIPYYFLNVQNLWTYFVMLLFNSGFSAHLYIFSANYFSKRMDPDKGAMMNYEGVTLVSIILAFIIILVPILIMKLVTYMGYAHVGWWLIGGIGLIGLALHRGIISSAEQLFQNNKYRLAQEFRNKT